MGMRRRRLTPHRLSARTHKCTAGGRLVPVVDVPVGGECEVVLSPGAASATLDGAAADAPALGRVGAGRHAVEAVD